MIINNKNNNDNNNNNNKNAIMTIDDINNWTTASETKTTPLKHLSILKIALCLILSGNAYFTFELQAFSDSGYTLPVPDRVALDLTVYFKALVVTQSGAPNLDLFPVHCWSSQSFDPASPAGKFTLIENGLVLISIV